MLRKYNVLFNVKFLVINFKTQKGDFAGHCSIYHKTNLKPPTWQYLLKASNLASATREIWLLPKMTRSA